MTNDKKPLCDCCQKQAAAYADCREYPGGCISKMLVCGDCLNLEDKSFWIRHRRAHYSGNPAASPLRLSLDDLSGLKPSQRIELYSNGSGVIYHVNPQEDGITDPDYADEISFSDFKDLKKALARLRQAKQRG